LQLVHAEGSILFEARSNVDSIIRTLISAAVVAEIFATGSVLSGNAIARGGRIETKAANA
jgi:hypothetical protein